MNKLMSTELTRVFNTNNIDSLQQKIGYDLSNFRIDSTNARLYAILLRRFLERIYPANQFVRKHLHKFSYNSVNRRSYAKIYKYDTELATGYKHLLRPKTGVTTDTLDQYLLKLDAKSKAHKPVHWLKDKLLIPCMYHDNMSLNMSLSRKFGCDVFQHIELECFSMVAIPSIIVEIDNHSIDVSTREGRLAMKEWQDQVAQAFKGFALPGTCEYTSARSYYLSYVVDCPFDIEEAFDVLRGVMFFIKRETGYMCDVQNTLNTKKRIPLTKQQSVFFDTVVLPRRWQDNYYCASKLSNFLKEYVSAHVDEFIQFCTEAHLSPRLLYWTIFSMPSTFNSSYKNNSYEDSSSESGSSESDSSEDDLSQDGSFQDDPSKDDPSKDDPSKDDPSKDVVKKIAKRTFKKINSYEDVRTINLQKMLDKPLDYDWLVENDSNLSYVMNQDFNTLRDLLDIKDHRKINNGVEEPYTSYELIKTFIANYGDKLSTLVSGKTDYVNKDATDSFYDDSSYESFGNDNFFDACNDYSRDLYSEDGFSEDSFSSSSEGASPVKADCLISSPIYEDKTFSCMLNERYEKVLVNEHGNIYFKGTKANKSDFRPRMITHEYIYHFSDYPNGDIIDFIEYALLSAKKNNFKNGFEEESFKRDTVNSQMNTNSLSAVIDFIAELLGVQVSNIASKQAVDDFSFTEYKSKYDAFIDKSMQQMGFKKSFKALADFIYKALHNNYLKMCSVTDVFHAQRLLTTDYIAEKTKLSKATISRYVAFLTGVGILTRVTNNFASKTFEFKRNRKHQLPLILSFSNFAEVNIDGNLNIVQKRNEPFSTWNTATYYDMFGENGVIRAFGIEKARTFKPKNIENEIMQQFVDIIQTQNYNTPEPNVLTQDLSSEEDLHPKEDLSDTTDLLSKNNVFESTNTEQEELDIKEDLYSITDLRLEEGFDMKEDLNTSANSIDNVNSTNNNSENICNSTSANEPLFTYETELLADISQLLAKQLQEVAADSPTALTTSPAPVDQLMPVDNVNKSTYVSESIEVSESAKASKSNRYVSESSTYEVRSTCVSESNRYVSEAAKASESNRYVSESATKTFIDDGIFDESFIYETLSDEKLDSSLSVEKNTQTDIQLTDQESEINKRLLEEIIVDYPEDKKQVFRKLRPLKVLMNIPSEQLTYDESILKLRAKTAYSLNANLFSNKSSLQKSLNIKDNDQSLEWLDNSPVMW